MSTPPTAALRLDHGTIAWQSLDPNKQLCAGRQFPLRVNVSTPNMQFGIRPEGILFLGGRPRRADQLMTPAARLPGAFTLPGATPVVSFTNGIDPYVVADRQWLCSLFLRPHRPPSIRVAAAASAPRDRCLRQPTVGRRARRRP